VLISDPEFGYISSAMESTETSPRMISVQMPSPDVEPDELPNEIMKDFENLDEHNESINETEDFILQVICCLEKAVSILIKLVNIYFCRD